MQIEDIYEFVIKYTRFVWLPIYALFTLTKELFSKKKEK